MPSDSGLPLVSVLMPAYNHAPYVRPAVESVLGQTYANLELIVIDDASSDETWSLLQSFGDGRMRLLRHEANQGAHATLNEALALAQGEFIAIINSDDVYHPERLERLVSEAKRAGENTLIFTDVGFIDDRGSPAEDHPRALGYRVLKARCARLPALFWLLTGNPVISTSNLFCSRTLARATGAFVPLRYTHDWDWALRATAGHAPVWLHEPLLSYRVHASNTLTEDDSWRHIHENSYIQAKALRALGETSEHGSGDGEASRMACNALLANESFHPLALCLYLTCIQGGIGEVELLTMSCTHDGNWFLKRLADAARCPAGVFGSIGSLVQKEDAITAQKALIEERWGTIQEMNQKVAERDRTIAAQAGMVEERWQAIQEMSEMIAERDRTVAAQAALIDERWQAIQQMSAEIASRDCKIGELEKDLMRPLVRFARFVHRKLD